MKLIALIPAYNPDASLITLVDELNAMGIRPVVIDDGSDDSYNDVFLKINDCAAVWHQNPNQGKGAALKTGMKYILDHEAPCIVITADADGQHLPADILSAGTAAAENPGSLILGVRTFRRGEVPFRSYYGNRITETVFRVFTGAHVSDTQTGLRAFHSSLIPSLLKVEGNRYEYEMNQLLYAVKQNIPMKEVPISAVYLGNNESSHFHPLRDSFLIYRQLVKFALSGIVCFLTDYILFSLLSVLLSGPYAVLTANVTARIISATLNYEINRSLIFQDTASRKKSIWKYILLAALILTLNTSILYVLTQYLQINHYIAKILTELALFVFSWIAQHHFVFAQKRGPETT